MFRPIIVIWLVLLVLVLSVVGFVTRLINRYRLADRLSKSSERTISLIQSNEPATLKHHETQPTHPRHCRFIRSSIAASEQEPVEQNAFGEDVSGIFHLYQETNKDRAVLSLI
jgi:hypothetical protein